MERTHVFAGGQLTVLVQPVTHSVQQCLNVLRAHGLQAVEHDSSTVADGTGEQQLLVAVPCEHVPSLDDINDLHRRVSTVLGAAGIAIDVHASGYRNPRLRVSAQHTLRS